MSDRKKALLLFPHGIGDVIMATPSLRTLHNAGYDVDMMVRPSVIDSRVLDSCPYVKQLIRSRTDTTEHGFNAHHMPRFRALSKEYDWHGVSRLHAKCSRRTRLIAEELKLRPESWDFELWVSDACKKEADAYLAEYVPDGEFVYMHTLTEVHRTYWWNSKDYVRAMYGALPVLDSGFKGNIYRAFDNINTNFEILRRAKHRVLSISVMAAAADAMQLPIDMLNAEVPNHVCRPINEDLVKKFRVEGKIR